MIAGLAEKLSGRGVVASISGGKDSAAMSLWLTEQGIEHSRVFMDTDWEHPATYEYLRGALTSIIGPVEEIRATETLPEMARRKGIFPSRMRRWCTEKLKMHPLRDWIARTQDGGYDVVSAVGIRAQESSKRAAMASWEWSDGLDCEVWRPLLAWSFEDVVAIHTRHGLPPNPLYLKGASRVGCFPCINAGRDELLLMARIWPERIDEIRALEAEVTEASRAVVASRGETLRHPRTLLRERRPGIVQDIDAQMAWAGSSQTDLFADEEPGCMRWGLCETSTDKETP